MTDYKKLIFKDEKNYKEARKKATDLLMSLGSSKKDIDREFDREHIGCILISVINEDPKRIKRIYKFSKEDGIDPIEDLYLILNI